MQTINLQNQNAPAPVLAAAVKFASAMGVEGGAPFAYTPGADDEDEVEKPISEWLIAHGAPAGQKWMVEGYA